MVTASVPRFPSSIQHPAPDLQANVQLPSVIPHKTAMTPDATRVASTGILHWDSSHITPPLITLQGFLLFFLEHNPKSSLQPTKPCMAWHCPHANRLSSLSSSLPFAHEAQPHLATLLFFKHSKLPPASRPLHWLFLPPEVLSPGLSMAVPPHPSGAFPDNLFGMGSSPPI